MNDSSYDTYFDFVIQKYITYCVYQPEIYGIGNTIDQSLEDYDEACKDVDGGY